MVRRTLFSTAEQSDDRRKGGRVRLRAVRTAIAASVTLGLAAPARGEPQPDPAPYPDLQPSHPTHGHHHRRRPAKHRAHKTDRPGYEFELIVEGPHVLSGDEELGNQAAVEALEHPGPPVTPEEEQISMEAER